MSWDIFNLAANSATDSAGGADSVFGTKPKVADFTPTDLKTEQGKAVGSNAANAGSIMSMLDQFVPGFTDMLRQGTTNAASELRGEIPQDVQDQIKRSDAFQSLMGGYSGTGMSGALTARDLGRTSLDLTTMGNNTAQQWAKLAESSASPFMINTAEQAQNTQENNAGVQANQQYKYNVAAAPDPGAAGIFNLQTALGMKAASFGMGAAGGAMGGAAGGAAGGSGGTTYQPYGGGYPTSNATGTAPYGFPPVAYNAGTGTYGGGVWGADAAPYQPSWMDTYGYG